MLGGKASGTAILGDATWELRDADVYGEKNCWELSGRGFGWRIEVRASAPPAGYSTIS